MNTIKLFAPGLLILLAACGDAPTPTTLAVLSEVQQDFSGRHVRVSGTLRTFAAPRHYWIENDLRNRVAINTDQDLAPLAGKVIEVEGVFWYDRTSGRRINATALRVTGASPAPPT
jgi:hypothetical protein